MNTWVNKENDHNGVLSNLTKQAIFPFCGNINKFGGYYGNYNKTPTGRQILPDFNYLWNLK